MLEDGEPVGTQVSRERLSVVPVKFIPEKKPAVLTRDVAFEISGTFVDENGNPFEEREVQLELKHERRSMKQRVMLDSQGRGRVTVRLPADWPLGPTEAIWRVFEAE